MQQIGRASSDPVIYITWRHAGLSASAELLVHTVCAHVEGLKNMGDAGVPPLVMGCC